MDITLTLRDPDGLYELLLDAHRGLNDAESARLNARLVLLLANQVGDDAIVAECVRAARTSGPVGRAA
jgi:hypothetical protein